MCECLCVNCILIDVYPFRFSDQDQKDQVITLSVELRHVSANIFIGFPNATLLFHLIITM